MSDFKISPISTLFPAKKRPSFFDKELDISGLHVLIAKGREKFRIRSAHDLDELDEKISIMRTKFWFHTSIELLNNTYKSISIFDLLSNEDNDGDEANRKKKLYEMIGGLRSGQRNPYTRTIERFEMAIPGTANLFNHPIWQALSSKPISPPLARLFYERMPGDIKRAIDIDFICNPDKSSFRTSSEIINKISMSEDPLSALALLLQILKKPENHSYNDILHAIYKLLLVIGIELQRWDIAVEIIELSLRALRFSAKDGELVLSMTAEAIFENGVKTSMIPFIDIVTGKITDKQISFPKRLRAMRAQLIPRKHFYYEVIPNLVMK